MTFTRVAIFGSSGLLLLQLVGCSAGSASDAPQTAKSDTQKERVDSSGGVSKTSDETPPAGPLDLTNIKWRNTLVRPPVFVPTEVKDDQGRVIRHDYKIKIRATKAQMLPSQDYAETPVFAYGGQALEDGKAEAAEVFGSPGATFEMTRGIPARVEWINEITGPHYFAIDPTLHWANPNHLPMPEGPFDNFPAVYPGAQSPVPVVTHVHGLEVTSGSDGGPEAWFTADGLTGPQFKSRISDYPNSQPGTSLWYHDHALGITRLNVYAGLAGMYIIRDPLDPIENPPDGVRVLPDRAHEMPLVIQDKSFDSDGKLRYESSRSDYHPYWSSYFGGDAFVVNGKIWPKMTVERTRYRFRMLNGANHRTFNLSLPNGPTLTVIGSDGGFLPAPAPLSSLRLAPGERADVLIDFSTVQPGTDLILQNDGEDVVEFSVPLGAAEVEPSAPLPQTLSTLPTLTPNVVKRTVTLESAADYGFLLNGQMFDSAITEQPKVGSTEDWEIVNISDDIHPIHLHLVQFRVLGRQALSGGYATAWSESNGATLPLVKPLEKPTQNPNADDYLTGDSLAPEPSESGWKDTVVAPPGYVTRIRVRWAPQDAPASTEPGNNAFPFDPTGGPGYVWHCHMLEHEDNEMMRPLTVVK